MATEYWWMLSEDGDYLSIYNHPPYKLFTTWTDNQCGHFYSRHHAYLNPPKHIPLPSIFPFPPASQSQRLRSHRILSQMLLTNRHKLRPHIPPPPHRPPRTHKQRTPPRNQRRIIHSLRRNGHIKREAKDDNKRHNIQHTDRVNCKPHPALHPKPAGRDVVALAEEMG